MLLSQGRAAPVPSVPPERGCFGLFLYSEIKPEPCQSGLALPSVVPACPCPQQLLEFLAQGFSQALKGSQGLLPEATGPPSSPGLLLARCPSATSIGKPRGEFPQAALPWELLPLSVPALCLAALGHGEEPLLHPELCQGQLCLLLSPLVAGAGSPHSTAPS